MNCDHCGKAATLERGEGWLLRPDLSPVTATHLSRTRFRRLCGDCIATFEVLAHRAEGQSLPRRPQDWQEGLHYYIEGGRWVFTAQYHVMRGYCCGSGCRHCAYGIHLSENAPE